MSQILWYFFTITQNAKSLNSTTHQGRKNFGITPSSTKSDNIREEIVFETFMWYLLVYSSNCTPVCLTSSFLSMHCGDFFTNKHNGYLDLMFFRMTTCPKAAIMLLLATVVNASLVMAFRVVLRPDFLMPRNVEHGPGIHKIATQMSFTVSCPLWSESPRLCWELFTVCIKKILKLYHIMKDPRDFCSKTYRGIQRIVWHLRRSKHLQTCVNCFADFVHYKFWYE